MAYDAIEEARKLAHLEEVQQALKPQNLGSMFVKFLTADGPLTVNIHEITYYAPDGDRTFIVLNTSHSFHVYHKYEEINSLLKLSIIR